MKPLIILTDCDKEGYIRIKKEEFEKIIQNAYEEGKKETIAFKGKEINQGNPFLGKEITSEDIFHFFGRCLVCRL